MNIHSTLSRTGRYSWLWISFFSSASFSTDYILGRKWNIKQKWYRMDFCFTREWQMKWSRYLLSLQSWSISLLCDPQLSSSYKLMFTPFKYLHLGKDWKKKRGGREKSPKGGHVFVKNCREHTTSWDNYSSGLSECHSAVVNYRHEAAALHFLTHN